MVEPREPEGIEHFTPDTPVRCIYQFTGGTRENCDWKGLFKDLTIDVGDDGDGPVRIRSCPHCDCPFILTVPHLRELGKLKGHH